MSNVNGAELRRRREVAGLTGQELARRIGIHSASLSKVETGRKGMSVTTLAAVARELGCPLDILIKRAAA